MDTKFNSRFATQASSRGSGYLREIANALGVPEDVFGMPRKPHILHTDAVGTRWLLLRGERGIPVVRRISAHAADQSTVDETISAFLARDTESPQCQALAALIDRVLAEHFTD